MLNTGIIITKKDKTITIATANPLFSFNLFIKKSTGGEQIIKNMTAPKNAGIKPETVKNKKPPSNIITANATICFNLFDSKYDMC